MTISLQSPERPRDTIPRRGSRKTSRGQVAFWFGCLARCALLVLAGFLMWLLTAPPVHAQALYAQRATAARVGVQSLPQTHAARRALAAADKRVERALAALQRAERTLRTQQAPRPGERQHLVNGHSRLTSAYFERIHALETAVGAARAELQAAYAVRDALVP